MLTRRTSLRGLALRTASPVAAVVVRADGSVVLRWANDAMDRLLGLDPAGARRTELADLLDEHGGARLTAAAADLVRARGQQASVQVTVPGHSPAEQVWLHLLAGPPGRLARLGAVVRRCPGTAAVLHAEPALDPLALSDSPQDEAELTDRLGAALLRLRRRRSRVALAVARVRLPAEGGPRRPSAAESAELADRVRQAARETDAVVQLDDGRLAVVAEDSSDDGGIVVARRLLAVLNRPLDAGVSPLASVAVVEVADPDADPDAVLGAVLTAVDRSARAGAPGSGLTVLSPDGPSPDATAGAPADLGPATGRRQLRAALDSGRFVLHCRPVQVTRSGPAPSASGRRALSVPDRPTPVLLAEVGTVDAGVVSPVRVDAPGLAVTLDRWALAQVGELAPGDDVVVLRLQPGGALVSLREEVTALQRRRPGTRLVVGVPEDRLDQAVSAQRAALHEFAALGVGLGVTGWTGRVDVRTLVHWQVGLVQLSAAWHQDVLLPEGAATLAGLVAGLRAGLGTTAAVLADRPRDADAAAALAACGVAWTVPLRPAETGVA